MRVLLSSVAAVALAGLLACAEEPPAVAPPAPPPAAEAPARTPEDPPPVVDGDVTVAFANGVKILVKRIPGAEIASLRLYVRGGARDWSAADAGIERLALATATQGGTEALAKEAFARKLAAMGSEIGSDTNGDFSVIEGSSLVSHWDDTFALVTDCFLHPALPPAELELQRAQQRSALLHEQDDPDSVLRLRIRDVAYKGHPLENRAIGTKASISAITLDAARAHLARLRETSRLLFVTVGDVDPAHVVEQVKRVFGALPRGDFQARPFPAIAFAKPSLTLEEKPLATNYIEGSFPTPSWSSPDHPDAMVALAVLDYRLFQEVRAKRHLSYAPHASQSGGSVPLGGLYVTATDPNTTFRVMLDEVKKLKETPLSEQELAGTRAMLLTEELMSNESASGQASLLATAELVGGDYRLARTLPDRIRAVTAAKVQAFAQKYIEHLQTVVVGDTSKVDRALFQSL